MSTIFVYTRTIEIVIALLIGCFLCWLGYRLLPYGIPEKADLDFQWGKFKFNLVKASPGLFS